MLAFRGLGVKCPPFADPFAHLRYPDGLALGFLRDSLSIDDIAGSGVLPTFGVFVFSTEFVRKQKKGSRLHGLWIRASLVAMKSLLVACVLGLFVQGMTSGADSLESELMEKQKTSSARSDPEKQRVYAEGIQSVRDSGILQSAIQVGQKAPDFTLKNAQGDTVTLSTELKKGPVVLIWYRGGWCPYCNITLVAMQKILPELKAEGAELIALTPELPDKSLTTAEKNHLSFEVLTDLNHQVAKEYGVAFELTPEVAARYKEHFDLAEFNGQAAGSSMLPLAATYIITGDGMVRYAFLDADYRKRAEPREIVDMLKKINEPSKNTSGMEQP